MAELTGLLRIGAERQRQIASEGWTLAHDDKHGADLLEDAALCYRDARDEKALQPADWPWDAGWWKPKSRERNLERAGALYQAAAEVAERAGDYGRRDSLLGHVETCANLLDSLSRGAEAAR